MLRPLHAYVVKSWERCGSSSHTEHQVTEINPTKRTGLADSDASGGSGFWDVSESALQRAVTAVARSHACTPSMVCRSRFWDAEVKTRHICACVPSPSRALCEAAALSGGHGGSVDGLQQVPGCSAGHPAPRPRHPAGPTTLEVSMAQGCYLEPLAAPSQCRAPGYRPGPLQITPRL